MGNFGRCLCTGATRLAKDASHKTVSDSTRPTHSNEHIVHHSIQFFFSWRAGGFDRFASFNKKQGFASAADPFDSCGLPGYWFAYFAMWGWGIDNGVVGHVVVQDRTCEL